jgi:hypothetical protein
MLLKQTARHPGSGQSYSFLLLQPALVAKSFGAERALVAGA